MTLRIVVGVDLSGTGARALEEAVALASKIEDDELHPVFVINDPADARNEPDLLADQLDAYRERLRDEVLVRCRAIGGDWEQRFVFHVRVGEPVEEIHQVAVDIEADLIVVGTKNRKGLERVLLGSVAEKLVKTARVPVLVAHPNELAKLPKTERPDPPQEGVDLRQNRVMASESVRFGRRSSHISGLL